MLSHSKQRGMNMRIRAGTITVDALSAFIDHKLMGIVTPLSDYLMRHGCSIDDPDKLYSIARDFNRQPIIPEVNLFNELCFEYPESPFTSLSYSVVFSGCCQCERQNSSHKTLQDCESSIPLLCKLNEPKSSGLKQCVLKQLAKSCTISLHSMDYDGIINAENNVVDEQHHVIYSHLSNMDLSMREISNAYTVRSAALVCCGTGTAWYQGKTYVYDRVFHRHLRSGIIARPDTCICRGANCVLCSNSYWGGHLMAYSYGICSYAVIRSKEAVNFFVATIDDERIWIPSFFKNCYHILIR